MTYRSDENRDMRDPDLETVETPDVFLPYQKRWAMDTSEVKIVEKSRRVGLSWAEAAVDALLSASQSGMDVFYVGYNMDMAREFIEDCAAWSRVYQLAASEIDPFIYQDTDANGNKLEITAFRIRFPSGFKIEALSSRPNNLRGKQGKAVFDEAAFHDDLPGLIKAGMAFLMWGGQVSIISTHFGDDNYFNELINQVRAEKLPYSLHRIPFDEAVDQGLFRRVCMRLGKPWTMEGQVAWVDKVRAYYGSDASEELDCVPSKGGGDYLTLSMIEGCMDPTIPIVRWTPPAPDFVDWPDSLRYRDTERWMDEHLRPLFLLFGLDAKHFFGEDFARKKDLTVIYPLERRGDMKYRPPLILELENCPFTQQEQILSTLAMAFPRFCGGALDAGGNGAFLAERMRQRFGADKIHEIPLSQTWYLANMPPLKAVIEDREFAIPKDSDYLDDFKAIKKVRGVPLVPQDARTLSKRGGKRHGDGAIAGCLALYAARNIDVGPAYYGSSDPEVRERAVRGIVETAYKRDEKDGGDGTFRRPGKLTLIRGGRRPIIDLYGMAA